MQKAERAAKKTMIKAITTPEKKNDETKVVTADKGSLPMNSSSSALSDSSSLSSQTFINQRGPATYNSDYPMRTISNDQLINDSTYINSMNISQHH